jgi:hypothetical protein
MMKNVFFPLFLLLFSSALFGNNDDRKLALSEFTVVQNGTKTDIKWSLNRAPLGTYFTIEKSVDGKSFSKLIDLPVAENGNIYEEYFETDYQPYSGTSFYRIRQTDDEGNVYYSDPITLKYRDEQSKRVNTSLSAEDVGNLLDGIQSAEQQESLLVLRDADGNDHASKIVLGQEDNYLFVKNMDPQLATGIYRIVGASNNQLYSLKVVVK